MNPFHPGYKISDHLQDMLKTSPELYKFTLEALGKMAGFNSRSTFMAAVKKISGKTPLEYFGKAVD